MARLQRKTCVLDLTAWRQKSRQTGVLWTFSSEWCPDDGDIVSRIIFNVCKILFFNISFRILPVNKTRTLTPGLTHTAIGDLDMNTGFEEIYQSKRQDQVQVGEAVWQLTLQPSLHQRSKKNGILFSPIREWRNRRCYFPYVMAVMVADSWTTIDQAVLVSRVYGVERSADRAILSS